MTVGIRLHKGQQPLYLRGPQRRRSPELHFLLAFRPLLTAPRTRQGRLQGVKVKSPFPLSCSLNSKTTFVQPRQTRTISPRHCPSWLEAPQLSPLRPNPNFQPRPPTGEIIRVGRSVVLIGPLGENRFDSLVSECFVFVFPLCVNLARLISFTSRGQDSNKNWKVYLLPA